MLSQFYINSIRKDDVHGAVYGVVDDKDGVEEFYSKEELMNICKSGVSIAGVSCKSYTIKIVTNHGYKLLKAGIGAPVRITIGDVSNNHVRMSVLAGLTKNPAGRVVFILFDYTRKGVYEISTGDFQTHSDMYRLETENLPADEVEKSIKSYNSYIKTHKIKSTIGIDYFNR